MMLINTSQMRLLGEISIRGPAAWCIDIMVSTVKGQCVSEAFGRLQLAESWRMNVLY